MKLAHLRGAKIKVKWYWAPATGHMEAISEKLAPSAIVPETDNSMPYTRATGPPLRRPAVKTL